MVLVVGHTPQPRVSPRLAIGNVHFGLFHPFFMAYFAPNTLSCPFPRRRPPAPGLNAPYTGVNGSPRGRGGLLAGTGTSSSRPVTFRPEPPAATLCVPLGAV